MTSLPPGEADAERLLALNRGHWVVENRNHRPRDTTFGEDACQMHTGHGPANNAIVNNMALAIIFRRGFTRVQAAVQHFAMDRAAALRAVTESGWTHFLLDLLSELSRRPLRPRDPHAGSRLLRPLTSPNRSAPDGVEAESPIHLGSQPRRTGLPFPHLVLASPEGPRMRSP